MIRVSVFIILCLCGCNQASQSQQSDYQDGAGHSSKVETPATDIAGSQDTPTSSEESEPLNLTTVVRSIAQHITNDSLDYNREPYTDCSGIFLRFLDSLKLRYPNFSYPDKSQYRSSRDMGRWFHEQGRFTRISDALTMGSLIKPGMVMLYGPSTGNLDSLEVSALFQTRGINHVGVITEVETDANGIVTGYSLFHGQTYGKKASTTHYHKREYSNRPNYPPYGNGSQQWVGIASVLVD